MKSRHLHSLIRKYALGKPVPYENPKIAHHGHPLQRVAFPFADVVYGSHPGGGELSTVVCIVGEHLLHILTWADLYNLAMHRLMRGPEVALGAAYSAEYRRAWIYLAWTYETDGFGWDVHEDHELFWPLVDVMRGTECMEKFLDYAQITFPEMAPSIDRYLQWLGGRPIILE